MHRAVTAESTTSTGIITLETRSTPLRTPAKMMPSVIKVNSRNAISASRPLEMKPEKYPSDASALPWPVRYWAR